jgi:phosphoglycerate dehydrogenase-like enzyme
VTRPTVVVLDDWQDAIGAQPTLAALRDRVQLRVYKDTAASADELARRLAGAEIIIAVRERTRFDAAVFAAAPSLRLLVQTGGGLAHVDRAAAEQAGVRIATTGGPDYPVVELTIGLMIGLLRRLAWADRALHAGEWPVYTGQDCHGRTLGILGFGRIGAGVGRVAAALGMPVVAWGPTLTAERAAAGGATLLELDEVLARADVVSIHLRLSPQSTGLLSRERLALLRPEAYLINTARGAIVDESALVEMLRTGRLAGAALDVFHEEPLPADHPLRRLDNVLLTPHVGWPSAGNFAFWAERAAEQITKFLDDSDR